MMASIFATALTFPSYANPTNVAGTLTALTGTLTVPDPGYAWTPIVMGTVVFSHDTQALPTGTTTQTNAHVTAEVDVRMGSAASGSLVASGAGAASAGGSGFVGTSGATRMATYNASGLISVAQQYDAGSSVPSYTGSQDIRAWIKKVSGQSNINTIVCNLMVYILPTT